MNKDVIYIDVEDDITTIVGKIKSSKEKIIALVPPKRVGVLQSAVNMRLLSRSAEAAGKRVVLITNDSVLGGLAATAHIPIAKTLQSKPEIAEIPALKVDKDDDIIDGRAIATVGDMLSKQPQAADTPGASGIGGAAGPSAKKFGAKLPKVPNFNLFRKKLLLIGGGAVLLVGFLVWAIWFAPRATVIITAKTTTVTVDKNILLKTDAATDAAAGTIKAMRQERQKELAVEFTPTGKKKVGDKATGTMKLTRTSISSTPLTVPTGTSFSAGDYTFVSLEPATLSGTNIGPGGLIQNSATVRVQAAEIGDEYNLSARSYSSTLSGFSAAGSAMAGGSSREVATPSREDVARATEKLNEQTDSSLKDKLKTAFASSSVIIEESYKEVRSQPAPSVAIGDEAKGPVVLKSVLTVSMMAIDKADLKAFLEANVNQEIGTKKHQKIYGDGSDGVKFAQFGDKDGAHSIRLTANATVGPTIDEAKVKEQAKGRNYGDIQSSLESIEGVETVDTKFWPFWVRTVPHDDARIKIEFKLKNAQ